MATEPPEDNVNGGLANAVSEVSERASVLIREEIELAKAEISEKVNSLVRGTVVGVAAGIFLTVGLLFLLHAAAWGLYSAFFNDVYLGYLVVAAVLFLLAALAGWIASRAVKAGSPPAPQMAIEEAKLIRETLADPSAAAEAGARRPGSAARGASALMAAGQRTASEIRDSIERNRRELAVSVRRVQLEVHRATDWRSFVA